MLLFDTANEHALGTNPRPEIGQNGIQSHRKAGKFLTKDVHCAAILV